MSCARIIQYQADHKSLEDILMSQSFLDIRDWSGIFSPARTTVRTFELIIFCLICSGHVVEHNAACCCGAGGLLTNMAVLTEVRGLIEIGPSTPTLTGERINGFCPNNVRMRLLFCGDVLKHSVQEIAMHNDSPPCGFRKQWKTC